LWAKLWAGDDMKKLNFKKLTTLPKGKYPHGNGLYLLIYKHKKGKWNYRYTFDNKARD
jgi:hypothetical protein|tara:strand:+ start:1534 stop:1707 length:174 start_codon:yes stop_codon:yes gene_type:complete